MAAPWYQVADWPDELARWIWRKGPGRVNENAITYYFAVYNAVTAGTATMWFTADNWAELSVNDVVIATSLDRTVTYNAAFCCRNQCGTPGGLPRTGNPPTRTRPTAGAATRSRLAACCPSARHSVRMGLLSAT